MIRKRPYRSLIEANKLWCAKRLKEDRLHLYEASLIPQMSDDGVQFHHREGWASLHDFISYDDPNFPQMLQEKIQTVTMNI